VDLLPLNSGRKTTFVFIGTLPTKDIVCEQNDLPCGRWGCYNTVTETCHHFGHDRKKCKKTESVCRKTGYGSCYDEKTHDCVEGQGQWSSSVFLCLKGHEACADQCFDPKTSVCERGTICQKGSKACGTGSGAVCYDPSQQHCTDGKICSIQEKACAGVCYPTYLNKTCFRIRYNNAWDELSSFDTLW